jgi:hypothetical protein
MENSSTWTSLELAKLFVSLLTPLIVAVLGYWFNRCLKEIDHENWRRIELNAQEQQRLRDEIERRHKRHIEFTLGCTFFGPLYMVRPERGGNCYGLENYRPG